jgi:hypothetical protein
MRLQIHSGHIRLNLSRDETLLIHNVLNEVLNGFVVTDFNKRIGASSDVVVGDLYPRVRISENDQPADVEVSREELLVLRNSLRECLSELGKDEFPIRVGLPFHFGDERLNEMDNFARGIGK